MIDNLELITPLLEFTDEYDFYKITILIRKKDQEIKENHQSSRIIKVYYIDNLDCLHKKYDEIKKLCELFNARAYINLKKYNHKDIGIKMIELISKQISSKQYIHNNIFDKALEASSNSSNKRLIDIDTKDENFDRDIQEFINKKCKPYGNKIILNVPTNQGHHLITKKFDLQTFKKKYPKIDVHKHNFTVLYIP